ncbi:acetyl-CoA synthase subunit gamma [Geobacter chapellei]|uniref:Acetyl-CoA synthase subunit gamma n=2 Tax=Pelotalea chapellei TaxID=44671 RepID=A0ABS5UB64_9BACT|nr:acetyl-CoA synthase subunit gamma [Pelotalea chapellei]
METPAGRVARISSVLGPGDHLGACLARWGIGRMSYMVPAGLYALGNPAAADPILVTANYKMSYDSVRQALVGRNCWLLVLETYGINVWCAAGKGTFGTGELVNRITSSRLANIVSHRRVILPILGAPGVSAHEVARRSGFSVSYAAIRANDLPEYLDKGLTTTPAMQSLNFNFYDRLVLIPVELVLALKSIAVAGGGLFVSFAVTSGLGAGLTAFLGWLGACLAGIVVGPLLLPWLPGRSFAVKGAVAGLVWSVLFFLLVGGQAWGAGPTIAAFLALPAVSAFHTLNFTGCSPYTSRSGVKKEMRMAIPAMGGAVVVSLLVLLVGRFL